MGKKKDLFQAKVDERAKWEQHFEVSLDEVVKKHALADAMSSETSLEEFGGLLTVAAQVVTLKKMSDKIKGVNNTQVRVARGFVIVNTIENRVVDGGTIFPDETQAQEFADLRAEEDEDFWDNHILIPV